MSLVESSLRSTTQSLGIKSIFISPSHPQANGKVEKFNQQSQAQARIRVLLDDCETRLESEQWPKV